LRAPIPVAIVRDMPLRRRVAAVAGLLVVALVFLVLVGTNVTSCLGPLGRTVVQSLADRCTSPFISPGMAVPVALLVVAFVVAFDAPGRLGRSRLAGAAVGAVLGAAVYALVRTTSMTGPTSTGAIITVTLPFDPAAAAIAALVVGGVGWVVMGWVASIRTRASGPAARPTTP
jgi:hypothetical protein